MQHPPSYGTILVIAVSALSLVAGLIVVLVTSPDSIKLGSQLQGVSAVTATPTAIPPTDAPAPTATLAPTQPPTTPTPKPTRGPTATFEALDTSTPEFSPTPEGPVIPTKSPDAVSVGKIFTNDNSTARLRSAPSLDGKVIEAIEAGEYVQVLGPVTKADDIEWLPIRHNKTSGWVAKALVGPATAP